jgi:hypothetical protein
MLTRLGPNPAFQGQPTFGHGAAAPSSTRPEESQHRVRAKQRLGLDAGSVVALAQ